MAVGKKEDEESIRHQNTGRLLCEKGSREVRALGVSCYTGLQGSPGTGHEGWCVFDCVCDQSEDGRTNRQSSLGSLLAL